MKSSKFRLSKLVALVIVMAQLLSLSTVVAFASSNDETIQQNEPIISEESKSTDESNPIEDTIIEPKRELKPVISSEKVAASEKIQLGFDKTDVIDYYYVATGVTVTERSDDSMQFELVADEEFGCVDVYADYGNGESIKSSIYIYKQDETVYVSDVSKDRAWYNCMESKYNAGKITLEEWEDAYSEFSRTLSKDDSPLAFDTATNRSNSISLTAATNNTTVRGRLRWETDTGAKLPLRQTLVELRDKEPVGSRVIAYTYTDFDGYFSFEFDNPDAWYDLENGGLDVFIRWYTQGEGVLVAQDLAFTFNYMDSRVDENVQTGSDTEFNYYVSYDDSSAVNKSFYVLQGMILGHNFARQMGFSSTSEIQVLYPIPPEGAFSYYGWIVIGNEFFYDFDTLIHEYGHFLEQMMGNYGASLPEIFYNWPVHSSYTDHFEDKKQKEYAMELTWSEAWATAFAQIAQEYYKNDYIGEAGIADRCDGLCYDTYTYTPQSGEAQEDAVIAFLWDLYDNVLGSYQTWWNYTTREGTYTLTDFVNVVETYYPSRRGEIGEIMAAHQISPGKLTIKNRSSVSATTPPTLSWQVNGSTNNPNNRFQVVFYDKYGNYINSSPAITSTQTNDSTYIYSISQSVWNQVIKNYGGTFTINIAVRAYHTEDPISGPYISKYAPITLTISKNLTISASNRYTESQVKLDKGGYCDYTVTFLQSGNRVIQTFGTKDTVLELYASDGSKLLERSDTDDNGYLYNALLSYNFTANVTYKIRVKFYSSSEYGTTKLTIVPTYNHDSYESAYGTYGTTTVSWSLSNNRVALFRYKFDSDGLATFKMSASSDTYLYIIDPASTEIIAQYSNSNYDVDNMYDDDSGGNYQAKITKHVQANKEYLVIISFYNPNTMSGDFSITSSLSPTIIAVPV